MNSAPFFSVTPTEPSQRDVLYREETYRPWYWPFVTQTRIVRLTKIADVTFNAGPYFGSQPPPGFTDSADRGASGLRQLQTDN